MTKKFLWEYLSSLSIREMQNKISWYFILPHLKCPRSTWPQVLVSMWGEKEFSVTVGGNPNWYRHSANLLYKPDDVGFTSICTTSFWSALLVPEKMPQMGQYLKGYWLKKFPKLPDIHFLSICLKDLILIPQFLRPLFSKVIALLFKI